MTKIKICGLKREEDINYINEALPDYVGFVFAKSKREVTKVRAKELIDRLDSRVKKVGVFVNRSLEEVNEIADYCNLDVVQLHGEESPDYCQKIEKETWKALRVKDEDSLERVKEYEGKVELFLLDAYDKNAHGGTGKKFNWDLLETLPKKFQIALAGGLNGGNIEEAIKITTPKIVDISSGVEVDGNKDEALIKKVVKKVRNSQRKFGEFGGQYVPETLMNPLKDLENSFRRAMVDPEFIKEYNYYLREYVGRETPLYYAKELTKELAGPKIYLKREDLNHTGAHKINNVIGQLLLAKRMGKTNVIAETGAGQHGVATATIAALFNMKCRVFMGEEDIERQKMNVFRMELLGAEVVPVSSGTGTLKDATNEAIREWVKEAKDTFYVIGSVVGPHPYPTMVRDFQKIIGEETKRQILTKEGRLPNAIVACVGGGSNAMGIFHEFVEDKEVKLYGVEAGGRGISTGLHAAAFKGKKGVFHGMKTYLLQDEEGQIIPAHSISAGLDYPGVGPEHSFLYDIKRAKYESITDDEALEGFKLLTRVEGIIPALESSHAVAYAVKLAKEMKRDEIMVINISGRGDKDLNSVMEYLKVGEVNE